MYVITFKNNMKQFSKFLFYRLLTTMYGYVQQRNKNHGLQNNNKQFHYGWVMGSVADFGVQKKHFASSDSVFKSYLDKLKKLL